MDQFCLRSNCLLPVLEQIVEVHQQLEMCKQHPAKIFMT